MVFVSREDDVPRHHHLEVGCRGEGVRCRTGKRVNHRKRGAADKQRPFALFFYRHRFTQSPRLAVSAGRIA